MSAKPPVFSTEDLEAYATAHLPKMARDYFNGGAMDSITLKANRSAYRDYYIRPRVLRDVSNIDMTTQVFEEGNTLTLPLSVAPAAMQKMAHPEGEIATARACGKAGIIMGLSSFSTTSLEEVKAAADDARRDAGRPGEAECVLQLYLFENRETSEKLMRRAEKARYKALVLTVDTPFFGRRLSEARNGFKVPPHLKMANFDDEVKTGSQLRTEAAEAKKCRQKPAATGNKNDASLTWDVLRYLKGFTKLPIWLKGILTEEDAALAVKHGADAVFVSNHGGRQLDGVPPTLDVLPDVVKAVGGSIPVHFDGGITKGSDVFKALCLGADHVWMGRVALWGIAYDGENGCSEAIRLLEEEFRSCMGLAGCVSLRDLTPEMLRLAGGPRGVLRSSL